MSERGVGPITAATPYSVSALKAVLPSGFNVVEVQAPADPDQGTGWMEIRSGGYLVASVYGTSDTGIESVISASTHVVTAGGIGLGHPYEQVYRNGQSGDCEPGIESLSGALLCYAPGSSAISLVFRGDHEGVLGTVPPAAQLADWRVSELWWQAYAP